MAALRLLSKTCFRRIPSSTAIVFLFMTYRPTAMKSWVAVRHLRRRNCSLSAA